MTTATAERAQPEVGELTHRQILTILVGLLLGMFLAALDQNVVSTAIRTIADDLGGLSQQAWATTAFLITSTIATPLYGKLSDIYGRKPFFLARDLDLHRRLGDVHVRPVDVPARGVPRAAGDRRGRAVLARADDPRRHRAAPRTRPLPGLLPRGVRDVQRGGPGDRRPARGRAHDPRPRRLALDLPHQRADRGGRAGRRGEGAQPAEHLTRAAAHRLARRRAARGRARAAVARRRAGPLVGLGLRRVRRLLRDRRPRAAGLRARRTLVRRRRAAAAPALPQQRVLAGHGGRRDRRHDDVRRDRGAAAVPADRARGVADRERLPHAAAGRGDHDRLALRPARPRRAPGGTRCSRWSARCSCWARW